MLFRSGGDLNIIKSNNNGVFLSYYLNSVKKYEIAVLAQGISVVHLYANQLSTLILNLPSLPEQTKIANFLSTIDETIQAQTQYVETLRTYKKGIVQQLFDQTIRFKNDNGEPFEQWEGKRLGDCCKITTGKLDANAMVENGNYRFYTCAKNYYQIDKFAFDTEALLISGNGANLGYIHYYKGKFNAYQRTYVLDGFDENIMFVKCFLDAFLSNRINLEKKEGNTPFIVLSTLSEMSILIPTLPEQAKIANFLSTIDEKIALNEEKKSTLEMWKTGLLQQMFV